MQNHIHAKSHTCTLGSFFSFILQSSFLHKCLFWSHTRDKRGAYKMLVEMLKTDPERPVEVPFTEAEARLWGTYHLDEAPSSRRYSKRLRTSCSVCLFRRLPSDSVRVSGNPACLLGLLP